MRLILPVLWLIPALCAPALAQSGSGTSPWLPQGDLPLISTNAAEAVPEAAWQAVVTGQIEAFRSGDGTAALGFAAQGFRDMYSDGDKFFSDIVAGGYGIIVQSRSHSFIDFSQPGEDLVLQVVRFIGPDLKLYRAMYQLGREADGWRVQAVTLRAEAGIAA